MDALLQKLRHILIELGPISQFSAVVESRNGDAWSIVTQQKTRVDILLDIKRGVAVLSSDIGVPVAKDGSFETLALKFNFGWLESGGATLSIDPQDGSASIACAVAVSALDARSLISTVDRFAGLADGWRKIAASAQAGRPDVLAVAAEGFMIRA